MKTDWVTLGQSLSLSPRTSMFVVMGKIESRISGVKAGERYKGWNIIMTFFILYYVQVDNIVHCSSLDFVLIKDRFILYFIYSLNAS